jgi:SAM-dependent methyltransferase
MPKATALNVDPANIEQARAWNGYEGEYWAAHAGRFDRAVASYRQDFLAAASIARMDRVLDIGCGTGQTTRDAARIASGGSALGVDLSAQMVDLARRLAAGQGVGNASFEQADAQVHRFTAESFDVAISRTGAMFFGDPRAAFTNIARALRPGGRLVMLTWQGPEHNEWIRELGTALAAGRDGPAAPADAPGPFSLADRGRVETLLTSTGFSGVRLDGAQRPMWFGADADDAHRFVLGLMGWMLDGLDDTARASALDRLHATLAAHETSNGVQYGSAAWTIQAIRA